MHAHPDGGRLGQGAGHGRPGSGGPRPVRRVPAAGQDAERARGVASAGEGEQGGARAHGNHGPQDGPRLQHAARAQPAALRAHLHHGGPGPGRLAHQRPRHQLRRLLLARALPQRQLPAPVHHPAAQGLPPHGQRRPPALLLAAGVPGVGPVRPCPAATPPHKVLQRARNQQFR